VRRFGDAASVIKLHADDREEVVESGLARRKPRICAPRKIGEMRIATSRR
jgi:hypothetical protein